VTCDVGQRKNDGESGRLDDGIGQGFHGEDENMHPVA